MGSRTGRYGLRVKGSKGVKGFTGLGLRTSNLRFGVASLRFKVPQNRVPSGICPTEP